MPIGTRINRLRSICTCAYHSSSTTDKTGNQPRCLLTDEPIKKLWNLYTMEQTWMKLVDVRWNKSDTERQILDILTYVWKPKMGLSKLRMNSGHQSQGRYGEEPGWWSGTRMQLDGKRTTNILPQEKKIHVRWWAWQSQLHAQSQYMQVLCVN